jgi:hypothetical protein
MSRRRGIFIGLLIGCTVGGGLFLSLGSLSAAKRGKRPVVVPVVIGGMEYRAPNTPQTAGFVEAWDLKLSKLAWRKKIYFTFNIPMLGEQDNQWNFIKSMTNGPAANELSILNEHGGKYILDVTSRRVRRNKG